MVITDDDNMPARTTEDDTTNSVTNETRYTFKRYTKTPLYMKKIKNRRTNKIARESRRRNYHI